MAQVPTQSYPPRAFFDDNIAFNASKLVGSFEHGCDYEIALNTGYNGATRGNFFVYKKRSDNGVFRAFLLGTVARVEPVDLHVDRLSVAILRNPTANAVTYFQNDVLVLKDIMAAETRPAGNSLPWVEDVEDGALIYVDVCAYTTVINGPVTHNATVLVDASFHRQDMREADTLTKVYRIIAHDVECIRSSYAGEMGLALTAESDLSTDVESVLADAVYVLNI